MTAPFRVVLDHADFLLVDKAPGIGMHDEPARDLHAASLGLLSLAKAQTGLSLFPVHRLDKMTSGLVLLAKHYAANRELSLLFAARQIDKTYLALSDQKPKKKQGLIKGDMQKGRGGSWLLARSVQNPAITRFYSYALPTQPGWRLYQLRPETGKTHQLRVALKSVGAPIVGDTRYGGSPSDRGYLHAWHLAFTYGGEAFDVTCPPTLGQHWQALDCAALLAAVD
ncbi:MAG: TIGR01621 family pseudouridine synthase [Aeromonas sp.]